MKKNLSKLGIERSLLNLRRDSYKKPMANILLNDEKPEDFPLR